MEGSRTSRAELVRSLAAEVSRYVRNTEHGAFALVGAVGLGKTTVLHDVAEALDGIRVVATTADEVDSREPFSVVGRLFTAGTGAPPGRVFAGYSVDDLDGIYAAGPVVLVVDDAHLADGESLTLLHRISAVSARLPLVVVLAYRRVPERTALTMFAAEPYARTVELIPLGSDEVAAVVRRHLGGDPAPDLTRYLAHAGGNPLHVGQLVDLLSRSDHTAVDAESGLITLRGTDADLSDQLGRSIRSHLARLSPRVRDLVQVLAVADGPMGVEVLADIGGEAPARCAGAVAAAVDAGVLHWLGDDLLDFVAPAYRQIAYDTVAPGMRRLLHHAVAESLARHGAPTEMMSTHRNLAAASGAFATSRQPSSVQAFGIFDPDELAATVRRNPSLARAAVLAESGRFRAAALLADEVLGTAGDDRAFALMVALTSRTVLGDVPCARASIDELLGLSLPPDTRVWLGQFREWLGLIGSVESVPDAPLPPSTDEVLADFGLDTIVPGIHAVLSGDATLGLEWFERGQSAASGQGVLDRETSVAEVWAMWAALYAHGPIAALARRTPVPHGGRTMAEMWLLPIHHSITASTLFALGRWDETVAACDDALAVAAQTDSGWTSSAVATAALVDVHRGDLESAERRLQAWEAEGRPRLFGLPDTEYARAELWSALGDLERARVFAARAWCLAVDAGRMVWALGFGPHIARIAVQSHDRDLFAQVYTVFHEMRAPRSPAIAPAVEFVEALSKGDHVGLAEAAENFAGAGDAVAELAALEEAACVAAASAGRDEAHEHARRARDLAVHLGASTVIDRIASRVRESGVSLGVVGSRRTEQIGWESLTVAEKRVARLVGQGLSGPQIAARLGVSPRTVQTHVSHALAKLGLHSRVGLARVVLAHTRGE
ncbi:LuxR C-terminal-related transcriptional regulator [Rhodococcus sp. NPDC060086]|uniref:LuxR C-terminal-related transcriptional regulator n=1 Tax=Rhodococcus sp. NPDC060086 TaxID=3347055 RepID=UPI003667DFAF